jgi:hypothetical protein
MAATDDQEPAPGHPRDATDVTNLDPLEVLYRAPSLEKMGRLSPANFERFVAHVLSHAGYRVKHTGPFFRRGVDLELLPLDGAGRKRLGGVECKRYNGNLPVGRDPVQKLAEQLP